MRTARGVASPNQHPLALHINLAREQELMAGFAGLVHAARLHYHVPIRHAVAGAAEVGRREVLLD